MLIQSLDTKQKERKHLHTHTHTCCSRAHVLRLLLTLPEIVFAMPAVRAAIMVGHMTVLSRSPVPQIQL